ncbi:NADPH-dependent F420 reductase [Acidicapsa dinghuensis]|uniref:NADPH-dependent F420 reductase n=1 Tax=Acidicapsa dinghuensis TaxID=2218256 RepID=A0ABW1ECU5_9BACT|nr:NADPH-dependent F420 reductase [Acidicapsa dinghuensis]
MKIAILGTGHIGSALADLWLRHGHSIVLGVRDKGKISAAESSHTGATASLVADAAQYCEVVVLAVPWDAAESVLRTTGDLAGKVLIDTTNPLKKDLSGLENLGGRSAAELVQEAQPQARVVKAFNTVGAPFLGHGQVGGAVAGGFYCSDDLGAKAITAGLVEQAGLFPTDCGALRNARYLEAMAMLWIDMAFGSRRGQRFAFHLLNDNQPLN